MEKSTSTPASRADGLEIMSVFLELLQTLSNDRRNGTDSSPTIMNFLIKMSNVAARIPDKEKPTLSDLLEKGKNLIEELEAKSQPKKTEADPAMPPLVDSTPTSPQPEHYSRYVRRSRIEHTKTKADPAMPPLVDDSEPEYYSRYVRPATEHLRTAHDLRQRIRQICEFAITDDQFRQQFFEKFCTAIATTENTNFNGFSSIDEAEAVLKFLFPRMNQGKGTINFSKLVVLLQKPLV
jgi:hypothetical protein